MSLPRTLTPLDGGMERFLDMDKEFTGKKALLEQQKRGVQRAPCRLCRWTAGGPRAMKTGSSPGTGTRGSSRAAFSLPT